MPSDVQLQVLSIHGRESYEDGSDSKAPSTDRGDKANLLKLLPPAPALNRKSLQHQEEPAAIKDESKGCTKGDAGKEDIRQHIIHLLKSSISREHAEGPQCCQDEVHNNVDYCKNRPQESGGHGPCLMIDLGPEQDQERVGGEKEETWSIQECDSCNSGQSVKVIVEVEDSSSQ